eukprot:TRINITY_DN56627_c0_g1_i1.p1 TRINITY_DN56627_c0_g1~~TRINITY_DN56627_c0_g1_i1.p1  ORF type:complete len:370 (-),score=60.23 TRINITY_DN56627_c0_g1_i1:120-1229(-)
MTDLRVGGHASAKALYSDLAELPGNPGSELHPTECKPCNKFSPARPHDSCKHALACEFCHGPHERPKHRGQRGRHALQRRQYLESRADMPIEVCDLVDRIYKIPHDGVDEAKLRLAKLVPEEREAKVIMLLDTIRSIGERAQDARPDNARLRGARITSDGSTTVAELDGRCKWLVGTLHLMVRKMWEAREGIDKIDAVVSDLLEACERIPEVLDVPTSSYRSGGVDLHALPSDESLVAEDVMRSKETTAFPSQTSMSATPSCSRSVASPPLERTDHTVGAEDDYEWLRPRLEVLEKRAREDEESEEEVRNVLHYIKQACGFLHGHMPDEQKESLKKSRSLWELHSALDRAHEAAKERLWQLDNLDHDSD